MRRWQEINERLRLEPPGVSLAVDKASIIHPEDAGARESIGWPVGQGADFRFPPESDCTGLHVHDRGDHWTAHLDRVHPDCDAVEHLRKDAPAAFLSGGAVLGAVVGAMVARSGIGAAVGAGVGALAAALLVKAG